MKLDFNIGLAQKQGLSLTLQVQQAIKLLQMTNLEVNEYIEDNFLENPFVELQDQSTIDSLSKTPSENSEPITTIKSLEDAPFNSEPQKSKTEMENQFETGDSFKVSSTVSKEQNDFDPIQLIKSNDVSMYTHCSEYIQNLNLAPLEHFIASKLLEELQPTGWMTTPLEEIARDVNVEIAAVENILKRLQMIEPAGLFCRNLAECLTLQANDQDLLDDTLDGVIKNLHLLGKGNFELLKRRCACSDTDLARNLKIIKSFDPKPGLKFSSEPIVIREPDLKITNTETGWLVSLNKSTLPSVKINKDLAKNIKKTQMGSEQKNFVKEKIAEANWLKNALQKRNETMLRVATEIAKRQTEFLEKGQGFITPMVLREVADAVNMHESTISRVTTGSLMETPQGTLELKSFFSTAVQSHDDLTSQSSASIKFKIKQMIKCENSCAPISDDEIVDKLKEQNISVARRTVAKYRKVENIPASFMRKRQNKLSGLI